MVKSSTLVLTLLKQLSGPSSVTGACHYPSEILCPFQFPPRAHPSLPPFLPPAYTSNSSSVCSINIQCSNQSFTHRLPLPIISTPGHADADILSCPYLLQFLLLFPSSLTYLSFHTGHCLCDFAGTMLFYTKMSLHLSSLVNVCGALSLPDRGAVLVEWLVYYHSIVC